MTGLFDSHCHLDSERFAADREAVLQRAWAAGLSGMLVPAVGPDHWEALLDLPRKDSRLSVALGLHPQLLPELPPEGDAARLSELDSLLARGSAVAIGECGLDGPSTPAAPMARQLEVLKGHLLLAKKHRLPVLLHCYRAHPALLELLESAALPEAGLVLHSYSGGPELVSRYAALGCHFSFAGPVTFLGARKPLEAARAVPLDRLLVETDAPDQAPHPHRGGRSEPAYLPLVARGLAEALGLPEDELASLTADTSRRLFSLPLLAR